MRTLLCLLAVAAFAQDGVPLFTKDFPPEEFAARRAKVYAAIGQKGLAIVQGAPSPSNYTRFRQSNEFYYLCGIEVPHAYLLLDGSTKRATVFLPHRNPRRESAEGKLISADDAEQVRLLSGIDAVAGPEGLGEILARYAWSNAGVTIYTPFSPAEGAATSRDLAVRANADAGSDPWDGRPSREARFMSLIRERFPQFPIQDLTPVLDRLRVIKSPREITMLRRATEIAGLALAEGMRSTKPGIYEYELDGMAKYIFFRNGAQGEAYYSLIASGHNAWYPHYNAGKRRMDGGEMLLMDFAPDVGNYQSDVTRMWPVNGKFNDWQRQLYGFYLGCYEAILSVIRPGVPIAKMREESAEKMDTILRNTSFDRDTFGAAAKKFVEEWKTSKFPALGHWVGLATHDDGPYGEPLQPGMVFTIEPALTVPEDKTYIRLEDMIVVTETGAEVISNNVPRTIDGIEKLMKEPGMLQRYPGTER